LNTLAVVLERPETLVLRSLELNEPGPEDVVVEVDWSGVSTGTERLFWSGRMPPFPGMGYPLVPGYEAVGRVLEAGSDSGLTWGRRVFVPGSQGFSEARGLFGAAARRVVLPGRRVVEVETEHPDEGVLLALAATALHAVRLNGVPELIVGHGVLGRLVARIVLALGGSIPTVWEVDPTRRGGARSYRVLNPDEDPRTDYKRICDVSGDSNILDRLIGRLARGGDVVLAGFYADSLHFRFPPAFQREARILVAAEWTPDDLKGVSRMVAEGRLSLEGLITHRAPAPDAPDAYRIAFEDPSCLKMVLDWRNTE
jgi:3-hydroxyethyl bacteriochlorophyllide a dehydrogenase